MLIKDLYPSKYLKADDIDEQGGEVRAVISKVKLEEMQDPEKGKEDKPILYFLRTDKNLPANKGLVLNKTNGLTISAVYGVETDDWVGKEVLLVTEMVTAFGETKPAIRVRVPRKVQAAVTAKGVPPPAETRVTEEDTPF